MIQQVSFHKKAILLLTGKCPLTQHWYDDTRRIRDRADYLSVYRIISLCQSRLVIQITSLEGRLKCRDVTQPSLLPYLKTVCYHATSWQTVIKSALHICSVHSVRSICFLKHTWLSVMSPVLCCCLSGQQQSVLRENSDHSEVSITFFKKWNLQDTFCLCVIKQV